MKLLLSIMFPLMITLGAVLKAPLMSLGASGKLGGALVFFGWKGLNVVREYVIPANPKTDPQKKQRGYLTDAVAAIHATQADDTFPLVAADVSAYALWASKVQAATTWFNQLVRNYVDQKVATKLAAIFVMGSTTPGVDQLTVEIRSRSIVVGHVETGNFYYGTSKTALFNVIGATMDLLAHTATIAITELTTGTKYYWQFRPVTLNAYVGSLSGIYYGVPL